MKKLTIIIFSLVALFFTACNLIWDVDTTDNISMVSCKPVVTLNGGQYISLPVGGNYTEQGVTATACDTPLNYTIVSGEVDPNTAGFYLVTYKAENAFGWATYAYRAVLVYKNTPYPTDIEGNYRKGFLFRATVNKYDVDGFWYMDNVWQEEGVEFPIVFAEDPNNTGHFIIVPGTHPDKGPYKGTAVFENNKLIVTLELTDNLGNTYNITFDWTKF